MAVVIDASVAAAWFLPDEANDGAEALLRRMDLAEAIAPSLFVHELRNVLLMAERRGRLPPLGVDTALQRLNDLGIEDRGAGDDQSVMSLARKHRLTGYDAAYLDLAKSQIATLATLDRRLAAAAASEGIGLELPAPT